jgi:hypothetical protein
VSQVKGTESSRLAGSFSWYFRFIRHWAENSAMLYPLLQHTETEIINEWYFKLQSLWFVSFSTKKYNAIYLYWIATIFAPSLSPSPFPFVQIISLISLSKLVLTNSNHVILPDIVSHSISPLTPNKGLWLSIPIIEPSCSDLVCWVAQAQAYASNQAKRTLLEIGCYTSKSHL